MRGLGFILITIESSKTGEGTLVVGGIYNITSHESGVNLYICCVVAGTCCIQSVHYLRRYNGDNYDVRISIGTDLISVFTVVN